MKKQQLLTELGRATIASMWLTAALLVLFSFVPNTNAQSNQHPPDHGGGPGGHDSPGDHGGPGNPSAQCDDNCPLVSNPDQADDNRDGVGNACTTNNLPFAQDSDADGVFDLIDNCVWVANPGQENTSGPGGGTIPDGIGDACEEQVAVVSVLGESSFQLLLGPAVLDQPLDVTTFITVDFDSDQALTCDWDSLSCVLDATQVQLCSHTSIADAVSGC